MWPNGAKCAVSIAYIGGLSDHADLAPPLLDSLSMPATFYVDPSSVLVSAPQWANFIRSHHEIGIAPFETANAAGELPSWEPKAVRDEIRTAKKFVREFFRQEAVGIAHRGQVLSAGGRDCTVMLTDSFQHILSEREGINDAFSPPHYLSSLPIRRYPSPSLSDAMATQTLKWIVIPFRRIFINYETLLVHRMVLEAVNRQRSRLYIAPVGTVAAELAKIHAGRDVDLL
jgi:hypothetical protein